jgi:hypothetical protein
MKRLVGIAAVAAIWLVSGESQAQTTPDSSAECETTTCRAGGFEVAVPVDEKRYTLVPVNPSPYVLPNGAILIFPGETIAIQFVVNGDQVTSPKFYKAFAAEIPARIDMDGALAPNPADSVLPKLQGNTSDSRLAELPANSVLVSYGEFSEKPGMLLILEHNLPKILKLDADMMIIGKGGYEQKYTSTCPIKPGTATYEMWPHPIGPIVLSNARFLSDSEELVCQ